MYKTGNVIVRLWQTTSFRGFQKHLSIKIIFPIEDLRQAVGTAKGILPKEKIERVM